MINIEETKKQFIALCKQYIHRDGLDKVLDYLEKTDFYTAPSSTMFHLNVPGGLCLHSMNVFQTALTIAHNVLKLAIEAGTSPFKEMPTDESIAITTLFHDLTKIGLYRATERWAKDEKGSWYTYKGYELVDDFPFGHGEKSCYRLVRYMELTKDELLAIRWHMGMFDMAENGSSQRKSFYAATDATPLVSIIHSADFLASHLLEETTDLKTLR